MDRETYLRNAEIQYKNHLADLYEEETHLLKKQKKSEEKNIKRQQELEERIAVAKDKREKLEREFKQLKNANNLLWDNAKKEFEVAMDYVLGDRESFIEKAELYIVFLGEKIDELESKVDTAEEETKKKISEAIEDVKNSRDELVKKLEQVKKDSSSTWKDIKHWTVDKVNSAREYIKSLL